MSDQIETTNLESLVRVQFKRPYVSVSGPGGYAEFLDIREAFHHQNTIKDTDVVIHGVHFIEPVLGPGANGQYKTTLQLFALSNVRIFGADGAAIVGNGPGDWLLLEDCTHVSISGIRFIGNRPSAGLNGESLYSVILLRGKNSHIRISDCQFDGFGDHAISHLWPPKESEYVTVDNCCFRNGGATGVPVLGVDGAAVSGIGSHWTIANNVVEFCKRGFEIENSSNNLIQDIRIAGNLLRCIDDLGVMLFCTNQRGDLFTDISIHDNRFIDFKNSDPSVSGTAIRLAAGTRIRITNNTVRNVCRQGIVVGSIDGVVEDVMVQGNQVYLVGNHGISLRKGAQAFNRCLVTGNMTDSTGEEGIEVSGVGGGLVQGNYTHNSGIYMPGGKCDGIVVSNGVESK